MWGIIIACLFGIVCVAAAAYVVRRMSVKTAKIEVPINASIINCETRKQFTNGYTDGLVKRMLLRKNGAYFIEFYPIDSEQGENKPKPDLQSFIAHKSMLRWLARGEGSARREKIIVLSRNPTDLPEKMRETDQGKWMTREGQLAWLQKTFGSAIPAGDEAISKAMEEYARGNISTNHLAQLKEIFKEMQNTVNIQNPQTSAKDEKKA